MLEALQGLSERRQAAVKAFQEEAQAIVKPCLQEFMEKHPAIKAVGWAQYTPYFNDGDACVFGRHGLHASIVDERAETLYGDGWAEVYGNKEEGFSDLDWEDMKALDKALDGLSDELEAVFGDHVSVIVTSGGVEVEEYKHD